MRNDFTPLELLRDFRVPRAFLGPVILRGDTRPEDATGLVEHTPLPSHTATTWKEGGMLQGIIAPPLFPEREWEYRLTLTWYDLHFSRFALDLLAHLKGTYRTGYASSFYGLDTRNAEEEKG
jgi:hypothetical protein